MNYSYVIGRLNEWGLDYIRREDSGLGWPKKSPFIDGMPITGGFVGYSPSISEACFEVDQCVCALRCVDEELYQVVMLAYVFNQTLEKKLKLLGFGSKQTYYNRLDRVHRMIQEYLSDLSIGEPLPVSLKEKRA